MLLPINCRRALAAAPPENVTEYGTDMPKVDPKTNKVLQVASLVLLMPTGPEVVKVQFPGPVEGITAESLVSVEDLAANIWQMGERWGVSFRASSVRPATLPAASQSGSAVGDTTVAKGVVK